MAEVSAVLRHMDVRSGDLLVAVRYPVIRHQTVVADHDLRSAYDGLDALAPYLPGL